MTPGEGYFMMRKWFGGFAALVLMISIALGAQAARTDGLRILPDEVSAYIEGSTRWNSWEITGWANPSGISKFSFVSVKHGMQNDLVAFTKRGGTWTYAWCTTKALPRTGAPLQLKDVSGTKIPGGGKELGIALGVVYPAQGESPERTMIWEYRNDGIWHLACIMEDEDTAVLVASDSLRFIDGGEEERFGFEQETNLKQFVYADFPETPDEIREAIIEEHAEKELIGPDKELVGVVMEFEKNRRHKVYQGPGERYGRSANGKGLVSTNDWIKVFGRENSFVMIQYEISDNATRFGWMDAWPVLDLGAVEYFEFEPVPATVIAETPMTDDPLVGRAEVRRLEAGKQVKWLAHLEDWAYIEVRLAKGPVRGFVHSSALYIEGMPVATPGEATEIPPMEATPGEATPSEADRQVHDEVETNRRRLH